MLQSLRKEVNDLRMQQQRKIKLSFKIEYATKPFVSPIELEPRKYFEEEIKLVGMELLKSTPQLSPNTQKLLLYWAGRTEPFIITKVIIPNSFLFI